MPQILYCICELADEKNEDILYLWFDISYFSKYHNQKINKFDRLLHRVGFTGGELYERWTKRNEIIKWLDDNKIKHYPCFVYIGCTGKNTPNIYVEVPFDTSNEEYKKLEYFLEEGTGECVHKGVKFLYMTPEDARKCMKDNEEER